MNGCRFAFDLYTSQLEPVLISPAQHQRLHSRLVNFEEQPGVNICEGIGGEPECEARKRDRICATPTLA